MKPEQLKVIAEGMGYKASIVGATDNSKEYVGIWKNGCVVGGHNPLINNDQMVDIFTYLIEKMGFSFHYIDNEYMLTLARYDKKLISVKGKTINEAVCNAAYEYFSDK